MFLLQRGDTSVEESTGNVKLTLERSSAKVEQVTGEVHVEGRLTDVSVSEVKKDRCSLNGEFMESVKLAPPHYQGCQLQVFAYRHGFARWTANLISILETCTLQKSPGLCALQRRKTPPGTGFRRRASAG